MQLIRGKRPKNNETARKTSKRKVMQLVHSQNTVTTSNVNRIANRLMEKLGQSNEMFEKLQEMANKQVEKYTGLFTENNKQRYKGKQKLISNKGKTTHAQEETYHV